MHWLPKVRAAAEMNSGDATALGVYGDLVRPALQAIANIIEGADATAPGQRHEAGFRHGLEDVEHVRAVLDLQIVTAQVINVVGADVEIDQLIHRPSVVALDLMDRVAHVLVDGERLAAHHHAVLEPADTE